MPKQSKKGQLGWIATNITSTTLKLSKLSLHKQKEAKVAFKIGQELLLQGMVSADHLLC